MIIVYPMLVSENINKDIIPGLTKSLEKYILVYNTDAVIKQVNTTAKKLVRVGAQGVFTVGLGVAAAFLAKKIDDVAKKGSTTLLKKVGKNLKLEQSSNKPTLGQQISGKAADNIQSKNIHKGGVNQVVTPRQDIISLEPTWVQIQTDSGTKLLGVKVVPYTIKTDSMVALLLNDASLKSLSAITTKYGRIMIRILTRAWKTLKKVLPGIQSSPVTGDAKNDIVWANTEYNQNMFICLSQLDLDQYDFQSNPGIMNKLKQLGWMSMIFADDVNKRATFCMGEFGGVCSVIPYGHIFAAFGKEHGRVYTDLEDAKKATGPFFRQKGTTRRKIFS